MAGRAHHAMTCWEFAQRMIRLEIGGQLVRPTWTPKQRELLQVGFDARRYVEVFPFWSKKTAKSTMGGIRILHHLVADPLVKNRRRAAIASADEEQSRIIFSICRELAERDPWLRARFAWSKASAIYTDPQGRDHTLIALPRDVKGFAQRYGHGLRRETVSKMLNDLERRGLVDGVETGRSKVWSLPVTCDVTRDGHM